MSKSKKAKFVHRQKSLRKWLFEQEDVFDTEAPEDEESPEEEAAETEAEGEEGAEAEATGDEEGEEAEEEELDIAPADEVRLSKSIDQDLEALLMDFEMQARKSREISSQAEDEIIQIESLSLKFLTEQEAPPEYEDDLDLERFSAEVARLVKNYTSLLDMEKMLVNKAREFVVTRYGEAAEADMLNILADKFDIEVVDPTTPPSASIDVPTAVGAGSGASGGQGS